jgi:hypothetical protein
MICEKTGFNGKLFDGSFVAGDAFMSRNGDFIFRINYYSHDKPKSDNINYLIKDYSQWFDHYKLSVPDVKCDTTMFCYSNQIKPLGYDGVSVNMPKDEFEEFLKNL